VQQEMSQMKNPMIDTKHDDLELTPEEVREIKRSIRDFRILCDT
jgi:hypothetical protein